MTTETTHTSLRGELAGLAETAHLLRSPRNARRLLAALRRSERRAPLYELDRDSPADHRRRPLQTR